MKIGLDAKWYFSGPPSGRLVTRNLVDSLLLIDTKNEYIIFMKSSDRDKEFKSKTNNVKVIYIQGCNNQLANVFIIPLYCLLNRISVVVFQNFCTFIPCGKKITFIHDVIFRSHPQFFSMKERVYFAPMLLLAKFSHRICTISQSEKKRITSYINVDACKVDIIPNGVDERFRPRTSFATVELDAVKIKYDLPEQYILYVGRLNERKNLLNLLKAVALLRSKTPLVIVGSIDWKMFDIGEVVRSLHIEDRVILTGFVPDETLPVIYALSSVFCFVSLEEGFGLPVLEAMASGLPIVVSDIDVMKEVCGNAAYYVNPHRPEEIANGLDVILKDSGSDTVSVYSRLERAKSFSWQNSATKLLNSIETCLTT